MFSFVSSFLKNCSLVTWAVRSLFSSIMLSLLSVYSWFLVSCLCCQKECLIWFQFSLPKLVLWPRIWPTLEEVPCVFEKNLYSFGFGSMFHTYLLSSSDIMHHLKPMLPYWFSVCMSFDVCVLLKSYLIVVLLSISPFISVIFPLCI